VDEQLVREEQYQQQGRLASIMDYDDAGQPLRQRKDINGDGRFDLVFNYIDGEMSGSVRDTDNNGEPNVWETYEDNRMVEQKVDSDGDGIIDFITRFDTEEHPFSMSLDNDKNGVMETYRTYVSGELSEEMMDRDQDGRYETIVSFIDGVAVHQKTDMNSDGKYDTLRFFMGIFLTSRSRTAILTAFFDRYTSIRKVN